MWIGSELSFFLTETRGISSLQVCSKCDNPEFMKSLNGASLAFGFLTVPCFMMWCWLTNSSEILIIQMASLSQRRDFNSIACCMNRTIPERWQRRVHSAILLMPWGPESHLSFVVIYIAVISNTISSYFILIHLFFGKFIDMITVGGAFRWAFAFFRPPHLRIALTGNFTTGSVWVLMLMRRCARRILTRYTLIAHQSTSFSLHTCIALEDESRGSRRGRRALIDTIMILEFSHAHYYVCGMNGMKLNWFLFIISFAFR